MNPKIRILTVCAVCLAALLWAFMASRNQLPILTYSQLLEQVQAGQIAGATVISDRIGAAPATVRLKNGSVARAVLPADYRDALLAMQAAHVNVEIKDGASGTLRLLINASPFLLLLGIWLFLMARRFPNFRPLS